MHFFDQAHLIQHGSRTQTITINVTAGMGAREHEDGRDVGHGRRQAAPGQEMDRATGRAGQQRGRRSTGVTIAGERFTLNQEAASATLKPTDYHAGRRADDVDIDVITDAGCPGLRAAASAG